MILKTVATGSDGNLYILKDNRGKMLLIECGINIKAVKAGCDWNIADIEGCIVTHKHKDHSLAVKNLRQMGIQVCTPYDGPHNHVQYGNYKIVPFALTDADNEWVHTNGDGSPCPIYGFLIGHPEIGTMAYLTDCQFCRWTFKRYNLSTILIGVDYQEEYVTEDDAKKRHVYGGHMELKTAVDFVKANQTDRLKHVIACHLSREAAVPAEILLKLVETVPGVDCRIATPGHWLEL